MKNLLITAIIMITIGIGCNIENNVSSKEPNYSTTVILIPVLSLVIYRITHLNEISKW